MSLAMVFVFMMMMLVCGGNHPAGAMFCFIGCFISAIAFGKKLDKKGLDK